VRSWAYSVGAKVERAKEHVAEFERASRAFLDANPYKAISQFNPKNGEVRFLLEGKHVIPARLAAITSDAVHNMRSALDIAWCQAWTKGAFGARKEYFPIVRHADELKSRFQTVKKPHQRAAAGIALAIVDDDIWKKLFRLNEINTRDKHQVPILAAAAYQQFIIKFPPDVTLDGETGVEIKGNIDDGHVFLKHGMELPLVVTADTNKGFVADMECNVTADISFGEGEILQGEPVLKTLRETVQVVDGLANAFLIAGLISDN